MIPHQTPGLVMRRHYFAGRSAHAASCRPQCASCGDATHLFRIAPSTGGAAGFQVEYTFECACGETVVLDESDLALPRR
jgi:hypothetical protein